MEIKIANNENKVYLYDQSFAEGTDFQFPNNLTVRKWTLAELVETKIAFRNSLAEENNYKKQCYNKLTTWDYSKFDNTITKEEALREYEKLENEYKVAQYNERMRKMAIDGINGALRYALAVKFNEVAPAIFQKFAGKKAGPKTTDKLIAALSEAMEIDGLRLYFASSGVEFYGGNVGNDQHLWSVNKLTDDDNRFVGEYQVQVPKGNFAGEYPTDWILWAQHVDTANQIIKAQYEEFIRKQNNLVNSLRIGDVGMYRAYEYELKERR